LDEAWRDLMALHDDPVTAALVAVPDIFGVVGSQTSTVRADDFSVVCNLEIFAHIQLFQGDSYL
jgi:hypothetical protein